MKQVNSIIITLCFVLLVAGGCNEQDPATTTSSTGDSNSHDWKFGIALWTFHDVDFPASLSLVDSAGLTLVEPNTFHKAGEALADTLVGNLSASGLATLKAMIAQRGLVCESVYVAGDSTLDSWIKQFKVARALGAGFVTTEPPTSMLNSIDSLAGAYGLKVAIHDHWKGVSEYWHPDSTLKALEGRKNFGVCADLGHFPKSGINPVDAVRKFRGKLLAIHLKDVAAYDNPALKDVPAGEGVVDFPAIFRELKIQDFRGNIYIERDSIEPGGNLGSVKETLAWYNEQVKKL